MSRVRLPKDSKAYSEQVFRAKRQLRGKQTRKSYRAKLRELDKLRELGRSLPRVEQ